MNIAQSFIASYESEDFVNDYKEALAERYSNEEKYITERIFSIFNEGYGDLEKLPNYRLITKEDASKIYQFVKDNIDEFISKFSSYYVGYTSLESLEFGEQEEQLSGLYNHRTGKDFSLKYLKSVFEKEGFTINRGYAYYIVDGGIHVNLMQGKDLLNTYLAEMSEEKEEEQ